MDTANEYGTLEMQEYLLPIMRDVDEFCRKHDIKYSLSDGTLLGAVRHKGYIPWDDDIDLSFDRQNFNKFMDAAGKYLPEEYEIIHDIWIRRITRKDNTGKNQFPPEGCIDMLIFDNVPESLIIEKIKVFFIKTLQGMIKTNIKYEGFSFKNKVLLFTTHMIGKIFPQKIKQRWYDRISQWGNNHKTKQIARFNGSYVGIDHLRYPAEIMEDYSIMRFENDDFMVMAGWQKFLELMYGDYMKIPDVQDRNTDHAHTSYWDYYN